MEITINLTTEQWLIVAALVGTPFLLGILADGGETIGAFFTRIFRWIRSFRFKRRPWAAILGAFSEWHPSIEKRYWNLMYKRFGNPIVHDNFESTRHDIQTDYIDGDRNWHIEYQQAWRYLACCGKLDEWVLKKREREHQQQLKRQKEDADREEYRRRERLRELQLYDPPPAPPPTPTPLAVSVLFASRPPLLFLPQVYSRIDLSTFVQHKFPSNVPEERAPEVDTVICRFAAYRDQNDCTVRLFLALPQVDRALIQEHGLNEEILDTEPLFDVPLLAALQEAQAAELAACSVPDQYVVLQVEHAQQANVAKEQKLECTIEDYLMWPFERTFASRGLASQYRLKLERQVLPKISRMLDQWREK